MGKHQSLTLGDVRGVFRLLGELRELGHDPWAWRLRMLTGLTDLLGAQVGLTGEMELPYTLNRMCPVNPVDHGWSGAAERGIWLDYFSRLDLSDDPTWHQIYPRRGRALTRCRDQFMPLRQWYSSEHVQRYRRGSGVDGFIMSQRPLPWLRRDHLIYILRAWNAPPLERRQCRILSLFHDELALLLARDGNKSRQNPRLAGLSPRLRQTLELLLAGHAEKAIARHLAISRHTVHQYIKVLYRRMGCSSHVELMATWRTPTPIGLAMDIPGLPRIPAARPPQG